MAINLHKQIAFIFLLFISLELQGQINEELSLREITPGTEVLLNKDFKLLPGESSLLLDFGKGKLCSCQFFSTESDETRSFARNQAYTLKKITLKGLFDGSQMHVARVYFKETSDYFKFKCYAKNILAKDISTYLIFNKES